MGVVADQLAAIDADGSRTAAQKRAARYQLKCEQLAAAVAGFVNNTYRYQGVDYTLYFANAEQLNGVWVLRMIVKGVNVTTGQIVLPLFWQGQAVEHVFVNPPISVVAGQENLVLAAQEMLRRMLDRFV